METGKPYLFEDQFPALKPFLEEKMHSRLRISLAIVTLCCAVLTTTAVLAGDAPAVVQGPTAFTGGGGDA